MISIIMIYRKQICNKKIFYKLNSTQFDIIGFFDIG